LYPRWIAVASCRIPMLLVGYDSWGGIHGWITPERADVYACAGGVLAIMAVEAEGAAEAGVEALSAGTKGAERGSWAS
jgi:hypothetical protein